jgi:hypothetical protein
LSLAAQRLAAIGRAFDSRQVLLKRMVDYLKRRETVALEEVGSEFNLRTAEAVAKLQSLGGGSSDNWG